jgi:hypothetical protein
VDSLISPNISFIATIFLRFGVPGKKVSKGEPARRPWDPVAVDIGAPTCNHAVHEFSENTSSFFDLVAPLLACGHRNDVHFD